LELFVTSPETNSSSIQVASLQKVARIGSCQNVCLTLAPLSSDATKRSIITSFELLALATDSQSIILGLPSLSTLGIGVFGLPVTHPKDPSSPSPDGITPGYHLSSNKQDVIPAKVAFEDCLKSLKSNKVIDDFNLIRSSCRKVAK
jgi:hypothetical protein